MFAALSLVPIRRVLPWGSEPVNIDLHTLLKSETSLQSALLRVLVVVVMLYVARRVALWWLMRLQARILRGGRPWSRIVDSLNDQDLRNLVARRRARIGALTGMASSLVTALLVVLFILYLFYDFTDTDLTSLLKGAGLFTLIIGLGAQAILKDFMDGIAMLIEDQFGVGDYVSVDGVVGTIQTVGLRVTTVKDLYGTLWFIRNSSINQLGNSTRGASQATVTMPLVTAADASRIEVLARECLDELTATPQWQGVLRGDLSVAMDDTTIDGFTVGVRVPVKGGEAIMFSKALRARLMAKIADSDIILAQRVD